MKDLQGARAWLLGDFIDTDVLAPGAYMKSTIETLAQHCLESSRPEFATSVKPGDIIVAGKGFGIGSSREQAALALKVLGVGCVLAQSFARIFYRNAVNLGLPVLVFDSADFAADGDEIKLDLATARVCNVTRQLTRQAEPMPDFLRDIIADGGLMPHLKRLFQSAPSGRPSDLP
jgi:3-isopropylmalate/(R)-2-methylmalate dehydratase small subunit